MILGVIRVFILNVINIRFMLRQAGESRIQTGSVIRETLRWFFPFRKIDRRRMSFTLVSILFHVAIIVTPLFLGAHIALWKRGFGISWPAIGQGLADWMTLLAVATALILFFQRVAARATRALSRPQDFLMPLLIAVPFVSGYLAMHPAMNPFSYDATMFVHVMSGNVIFILIPFSKLSHVVLFPTTQLISEVGWHLVPGAGARVAASLDKKDEPL